MIEVVRSGWCDQVMDHGRPGWRAFGVPAGGAADPAALAAANRLVGNEARAAGIEMVLVGAALRFPHGAVAALSGARFAATRTSGAAVAWNETLLLAAGETLDIGKVHAGCRCWLAVAGGIDVAPVLGSRSSFLPAGFGGHGGRALRGGDVLPASAPAGQFRLRRAESTGLDRDGPLRVIPGPQIAQFTDAGLAAFFGGAYAVAGASDRRGVRLAGPAVAHGRRELASQGVLPGAAQVPPDGQPVILGWDGPVTGGYPVIGNVVSADLARVAQLRPGDTVRFSTIDVAAARALATAEWRIEDLG
jgi:biotin-dependent carboxylase-like uncharacterized protein